MPEDLTKEKNIIDGISLTYLVMVDVSFRLYPKAKNIVA